jgi:hypothetical protein
MTSIKQIEANHRNSLKSTGPKTDAGKRTSRCNAVRQGLTAETVIGALEDAVDYKAFEPAITASPARVKHNLASGAKSVESSGASQDSEQPYLREEGCRIAPKKHSTNRQNDDFSHHASDALFSGLALLFVGHGLCSVS